MSDQQKEREAMAVELAREFYAVLAKYLPPTATLGELQVLTEVAMGMYRDAPVTVSEIGEATGLNRWSVSRVLIRYIEGGMIIERKDPEDSRRNLLVWTEDAFEGSRAWSADWLRVWQTGMDRVTG
jgi:DNA-binding MarR family transcriptional regulator